MKNSKDSNYTFRCNEHLKERFKMLCKIGNVSPSDVLQNVMLEFCDSAERVMEMKDISELRNLFNEKMCNADEEMQRIENHPTWEK